MIDITNILRFRDYNIVKRYNNAEYAYVANKLVEQVLAVGAEKLHAPAEYITLYQARCAVLDNIVAVSRIADQTEEIAALETEIDHTLSIIFGAISLAKLSPIQAKKSAGTSLYNANKVYRGMQKLPQRQKLQTTKGLLLDLQKTELSTRIETLGLSAEVEELTLLHAKFAVLLNARADVQMQNSTVKSKEIRQEMDVLYEIITSAIWVYSLTDPSEDATSFINTMNKFLADAETSYHQRKAQMGKKNEEEVETPSEEEKPNEEQGTE